MLSSGNQLLAVALLVASSAQTALGQLINSNIHTAVTECLLVDPTNGDCPSGAYGNISTWDVSGVTNFDDMFFGATSFTGASLSSWDVSSGTTFGGMFYGVNSITSDLSSWSVQANVPQTNMCGSFHTPVPLCGFVPPNLTAASNCNTNGPCHCTSTQVPSSDHASANSIAGNTTDTMNVTCNPGYIGGGSWTCGCGGTFSGAACTAAACTSTQVLFSNKATTNSIAGNTTDTMNVTCDAGYAGAGIWTCGSGGSFSGTPCTAAACTSTQVLFSNKATTSSIAGNTTDTMNATCNPGYIGGGTWTCGSGGTFSGATCTAAACTSTQVLSSNKATPSSIAGSTTDTVNVTCDAGYTGGGTWTCGSGGTFSGATCKTPVELNVVVSEFSDAPALQFLSEITMAMDIDSIPVGSRAREVFEEQFISDLATVLNIDSRRIYVTSIRPGSVVVEYGIRPDSGYGVLGCSHISTLLEDGPTLAGAKTTPSSQFTGCIQQTSNTKTHCDDSETFFWLASACTSFSMVVFVTVAAITISCFPQCMEVGCTCCRLWQCRKPTPTPAPVVKKNKVNAPIIKQIVYATSSDEEEQEPVPVGLRLESRELNDDEEVIVRKKGSGMVVKKKEMPMSLKDKLHASVQGYYQGDSATVASYQHECGTKVVKKSSLHP